ncbi:MAG: L-ribulose-5-phosphate 4-epimerase AraD [Terrimicrobiaceae bacterium]
MSRFDGIREECCAANSSLPASGLVDLTFGNVSILDRDAGVFAIKPSGVAYDRLAPTDMVILDLDGRLVEGDLRPSSDAPTHRKLFTAFPEIRAVVHTHSRHAVAFAQAGRELPLLGTTHADYFHGNVPVTRALTDDEIRGDYEWNTGEVIVETFAALDPLAIPAVLVRNHGPFAWGLSGEKAVETALALEIVAEMALHALALNPTAQPPSSTLIDKHFFRKHGAEAYYGQAKEA